ncbi:uncharacterized protein B0I36DRAFT_335647 [Microdochium trichocladiopsis]|uniref:Uncharacterized protein n=1 Tax=Microdochium trichocladiopsis TaxID=1682393 RepID=A0A9P9BKA2_9PEZI|nr:uncharacterized protein B0I36DRAFT_335647 [Microdochium trichocladiopsis]KAH7018286.1 hypothetical protein B0I36DRAFT_335647 [Microdochium trichocladiopsis]
MQVEAMDRGGGQGGLRQTHDTPTRRLNKHFPITSSARVQLAANMRIDSGLQPRDKDTHTSMHVHVMPAASRQKENAGFIQTHAPRRHPPSPAKVNALRHVMCVSIPSLRVRRDSALWGEVGDGAYRRQAQMQEHRGGLNRPCCTQESRVGVVGTIVIVQRSIFRDDLTKTASRLAQPHPPLSLESCRRATSRR